MREKTIGTENWIAFSLNNEVLKLHVLIGEKKSSK
jgi:hypothetical protein